MALPALRIHAGPRALAALRRDGLRPQDISLVPAAAGGPKGLVLNPLDQFLFADWLPRGGHIVHLVGASIGAWRMAAACAADARSSLQSLAQAYVHQDYARAPGKAPSAAHVSAVFGRSLQAHLQGDVDHVLQHPTYRLHVLTSHGRHVLRREHVLLTPLGYAGAFMANALSRRALGGWLERVVFSDPRTPLPVPLGDLRTRHAVLDPANLVASVLASCSIPFWLQAVHDIPGGPPGAYWDGGITDYHLHWPFADLLAAPLNASAAEAAVAHEPPGNGLVLYPHFQTQLVPGWLDKAFKARHRVTSQLDNLIVLSPQPDWLRRLPGGKLPDRADFKTFADDVPGRVARWSAALLASQQLADDFAAWLHAGTPVDVVQALA